jgi:hypothetical protein
MAKVAKIKTTMIKWIGCANRLPPACIVLAIGPPAMIPPTMRIEKKKSATI